ncbi:MAG: DUF5667 domain-containing protein [Dehalococcoidia bacterium]
MERAFEHILDECLDRVLNRGEVVEDCLAHYPEQAQELEPLLRLALENQKAYAFVPHPEKKAAARERLLAAIAAREERSSKQPWAIRGLFGVLRLYPRWAMAAASLILALSLGAGTVAASGGSMPDQPLYPVKRVVERVQIALTLDQEAKAQRYAHLAEQRLQEITHLVKKGELQRAQALTRDFQQHLERIQEISQGRGRPVIVPPSLDDLVPPPEGEDGEVFPPPTISETPPPDQEEREPEEELPRGEGGGPREEEGPSVVTSEERRAQEFRQQLEERRHKEARFRQELRDILGKDLEKQKEELKKLLEEAPEDLRPFVLELIIRVEQQYQEALHAVEQKEDVKGVVHRIRVGRLDSTVALTIAWRDGSVLGPLILTRETELEINGKEATLADLTHLPPRTVVKVEFNPVTLEVLEIEAEALEPEGEQKDEDHHGEDSSGKDGDGHDDSREHEEEQEDSLGSSGNERDSSHDDTDDNDEKEQSSGENQDDLKKSLR